MSLATTPGLGQDCPIAMCTRRIFTVAAILGLAALVPAWADTTSWVELHAARARLVGSPGKAASGVRLAGLEVELDSGWKTYWRMPGDAGVPPDFNWKGSANVSAIKVLYPAPKRMQEAGGEVIGYKSALFLPIEVVPADPAKPVDLKLALEIGICRDICVPASASLALTLPPPGAASPANNNPEDVFAAALARVPRAEAKRLAQDPELRSVTIETGESGPRLTIAAAFHGANPDVFIEAPEGLYVPLPRKQAPGADGIVRFATDLPADVARDLKGKTITLTLVSDAGAIEAQRTLP